MVLPYFLSCSVVNSELRVGSYFLVKRVFCRDHCFRNFKRIIHLSIEFENPPSLEKHIAPKNETAEVAVPEVSFLPPCGKRKQERVLAVCLAVVFLFLLSRFLLLLLACC